MITITIERRDGGRDSIDTCKFRCIRLDLGDGAFIDVSVRGHSVRVSSGDAIVVEPQAPNVVSVWLRRERER